MADKPSSPLPALSTAARESILLAPYAMHSDQSAGRRYPEPVHPYRAPYQRDRDRILHSAAFRRLSHKTQVFTGDFGDYHRSRLTHTLETASIARTLGRALRLNEDFIEAAALMHDIGHPPFGHSGEDVLNECLRDEGGFSHNRQALRIVEELERRYPDFPGLNLSLELLQGQQRRVEKSRARERPLLESQVVDAADSIAYDTHDADDALQLGLLTIDELLEIPLWCAAAERVLARYQDLNGGELRRAILHELIDWQVGGLLTQAQLNLQERAIHTPADVYAAPVLIAPDAEMAEKKLELEKFLHARVYRHPRVLEMRDRSTAMLRELFARFVAQPSLLPHGFQARIERAGLRRTVGDYLAGMTDRYLQSEYGRLVR
ncbi:MAG TPA: deoxyguanosinetriphosphate triphosphohydrolase [Pirellulales bacterium]|jgi:dGTPase|nr:deoxyguanosinetriphosphate triphosphohydrolase [Pirellulales bacterium]